MTSILIQALKDLQTKINEKDIQITDLNEYIKKLQKELTETKTKLTETEREKNELKTYKTDKENEEKEALKIVGEIGKSIDDTFAKIEVPPKTS